ncbi:MAG: hypothetical protein IH614_02690, partial [Desulfuromonadales bacterium]|nr:hypothetical protein [Desulfuromonadales bacterium]
RVSIDQGRLAGDGVVLRVVDSVVAATGLQVEGETALSVAGSRLDLAGVELRGRRSAMVVESASTLLFSVSRATSPQGERFLHGPLRLPPGSSL